MEDQQQLSAAETKPLVDLLNANSTAANNNNSNSNSNNNSGNNSNSNSNNNSGNNSNSNSGNNNGNNSDNNSDSNNDVESGHECQDNAEESVGEGESVAISGGQLSRKQQNRLKRQEKKAEEKNLKRQAKKDKKRKLRELRDANKAEKTETVTNNGINTDEIEDSTPKISRKEAKQQKLQEYLDNCEKNFSIVIDCDWENEHNDRALTSLRQQIMFCYGSNRKHSHPAKVYLTGVGQRMDELLAKSDYKNWQGVVSTDESYLLATVSNDSQTDVTSITETVTDTVNITGKELVYLTSDAEETITELSTNCAYIIGGIVDRNRLKGATYAKAKRQGIRTAKLPIKEYLHLHATHVLTVNHVFDILLNFCATKSWTESLMKVLPERKQPELKDSVDESG